MLGYEFEDIRVEKLLGFLSHWISFINVAYIVGRKYIIFFGGVKNSSCFYYSSWFLLLFPSSIFYASFQFFQSFYQLIFFQFFPFFILPLFPETIFSSQISWSMKAISFIISHGMPIFVTCLVFGRFPGVRSQVRLYIMVYWIMWIFWLEFFWYLEFYFSRLYFYRIDAIAYEFFKH